MRACVLRKPAPVETNPLEIGEFPSPIAAAGEVLIKVRACGICRTDLHVVEGELPVKKSPVIPGHQIVGTIAGTGARVGVAWLHWTDGVCEFCRSGRENLCERAEFTGYTTDGGYAEYVTAPEAFVYHLPDGFGDLDAAPLLCAGIIGFRCLRISGVSRGARLGLYGFGAAAHVAIQVARYWGVEVYAFTRNAMHQQLARDLGAAWAGPSSADPPAKLDAAIIFAPAGELVPASLRVLKKGGIAVLGGIHMSPIPSFDYELLYHERSLRSVANNTREDGVEFLKVAAAIPIRTEVEVYNLEQANAALNALKNGAIRGAAVLKVSQFGDSPENADTAQFGD